MRWQNLFQNLKEKPRDTIPEAERPLLEDPEQFKRFMREFSRGEALPSHNLLYHMLETIAQKWPTRAQDLMQRRDRCQRRITEYAAMDAQPGRH